MQDPHRKQKWARRLEAFTESPHVFGAVSLALMGVVSFFLVTAYLNDSITAPAPPPSAQTALVDESFRDAFNDLSLIADSAIVYDMQTKRVLYEKNADAQLPLASITKVMLTLAVSGALSPDTIITIPYDTSPAGSAQRLAKGEEWKLQDVINFTLIASSNEGANILAAAADQAIRNQYPDAPQEDATVWRMNQIAKAIGMQHTYFLNPNGLDISTTQSGAYGSARDVALMMAYAASTSPQTFLATAKDGLLLSDETGHSTNAYNTNEAIADIPGLLMGKTGYTDLAGGNLAVVFDVGVGHPVVAVVLGSTHEGRFTDIKTLVARAREAVAKE